MNQDQVKGAAKYANGQAREKAGTAADSSNQEGKGLASQGEGPLQKAYRNIKEVLKNSRHT